MTGYLKQMREAFEKWCIPRGVDTQTSEDANGTHYALKATEAYWTLWQSAWSEAMSQHGTPSQSANVDLLVQALEQISAMTVAPVGNAQAATMSTQASAALLSYRASLSMERALQPSYLRSEGPNRGLINTLRTEPTEEAQAFYDSFHQTTPNPIGEIQESNGVRHVTYFEGARELPPGTRLFAEPSAGIITQWLHSDEGKAAVADMKAKSSASLAALGRARAIGPDSPHGDALRRQAPVRYEGRARHENGMLLDWHPIDAETEAEAQEWAERSRGEWQVARTVH